jgi:hypothetical protein
MRVSINALCGVQTQWSWGLRITWLAVLIGSRDVFVPLFHLHLLSLTLVPKQLLKCRRLLSAEWRPGDVKNQYRINELPRGPLSLYHAYAYTRSLTHLKARLKSTREEITLLVCSFQHKYPINFEHPSKKSCSFFMKIVTRLKCQHVLCFICFPE